MDKTLKVGRLAMLALMLAAASTASCDKQIDIAPVQYKKHLEVVLRSQEGDYWKTVKMGAEVAAKEFEVTLDFRAPGDETDVLGQIALVEQSIESKPDAIVLAANDFKGLVDVVDRAAGQSIPVVTIDSGVDSSRVKSFIGADNYEAGQMAGRQLVKLAGTSCQIAIVSLKQGEQNVEQRERGLLDEISKYPEIKVLEKVYSLSNRELAANQTRDIIQRNSRIDGIVALNESSSIGVADEIQKLGLQGKVKIIAFDSTSEDLELLQEGVIQATIVQNPFSIGYLGVKNAAEAASGMKVPSHVPTALKAIDLDNIFWSDNQKLLFPFVK